MKRITCFLVIALTCLTSVSQTKRAVVIGLGKQLDENWAKINGDRDIPIIIDMLGKNDFTDIVSVENENATKTAIVNAFSELTGRCDAGDIVYVHFSGHGQQMTDLDGDEEDGFDESWIPYDAYIEYCDDDHGEKHLTDDEIALLLTDIRNKIGEKGEIIVVVDACHSGDSTRDLQYCARGAFDDFIIPQPPTKHACHIDVNWITLSACGQYECNYEHPDGYGSLSYALWSQWKELKGESNDNILSIITKYIDDNVIKGRKLSPQNPQITPKNNNFKISKIFND